jgi:hypothetical protein
VREDLAYFRKQLAQLEVDGQKLYSKYDIQPGDLVKVGPGWSRVVRANAKTVSVESGYSWTIRYRYSEIKDHRRPDSA